MHSKLLRERGLSASVVTVGLCLLGALCEGFDVQSAGVAAAGLRHELQPTPQALGFFFAASGAGLLIGAVCGGYLSDRLGRKSVLVVSIAMFGVCSLLTSIAPDIRSLMAARFLTGLGLGGALPNLIAAVADASPLSRRNASIAISYVGAPLGGLIASLIISLIPLDAWRTVFRIGGIAPLVVVPLMLRYLPARVAVAPAGLGTQPLQGRAHALFGPHRVATTLILWAGFFLIVLTLHLMLNWLPQLLVGRGVPATEAALCQAAFAVGASAAGLIIGPLLDSRGRRAGIAICAMALPVVLILMANTAPKITVEFALAFLLGGSIIAQQVIVYAVASACYDAPSRGTGMGAAVGAGRVGALVGPLFAAALLASGRSSTEVLTGLLPVVILCGLCVGFLGWTSLSTIVATQSTTSKRAEVKRSCHSSLNQCGSNRHSTTGH
jgi:MFS transporter, AAHS family, 3-hydroxyphenylpropionic acid transporter